VVYAEYLDPTPNSNFLVLECLQQRVLDVTFIATVKRRNRLFACMGERNPRVLVDHGPRLHQCAPGNEPKARE